MHGLPPWLNLDPPGYVYIYIYNSELTLAVLGDGAGLPGEGARALAIRLLRSIVHTLGGSALQLRTTVSADHSCRENR